MSEWKKVEEPVGGAPAQPEEAPAEPAAEPAALPASGKKAAPQAEEGYTPVFADLAAEEPEAEPAAEGPAAVARRYTAGGRRRGRRRYAAPLGLAVILLALVGLVSLVIFGVNAIRRAQDDTAIKQELYDFLEPLMVYTPITPFTNVNDSDQDALILSALWKITEKERIRMLRENAETSLYPLDDMSRLIIPIEEVREAYAELYGPDAQPYLHTIGDPGGSFTFEYMEDEQTYHVPSAAADSLYQPVADTLKKKGDTYTLRVGYVSVMDIGVDEKGDTIPPTADMAKYFQSYTIQKTDTGWMLTAVTDE